MITNVATYLLRSSSAHAQRAAVIQEGVVMTYAELHRRARAIAEEIFSRTEELRRPIAVMLPKSPECVAAFQAVLYTGNFYVPIDPTSPTPRLAAILDDLDPLLVITSRDSHDQLEELVGRGRVLRVDNGRSPEPGERDPGRGGCEAPGAGDSGSGAVDQAILDRVSGIIDTDPVYVKYTSGSTGTPKGVVLPHRAVIDYVECSQEIYELGPEDVLANQAPFTFDVSVGDIYLSLRNGATLLLVPEELFVFPAGLMHYLREHDVTWFCWVPSVLVNVCNLDLLAGADTTTLLWVTVLGEVMPTKHFLYWRRHCPKARLVNTYGPTETAVASTYFVLDREIGIDEPLPIGRPYRNTDVLVLDASGTRCAAGEQGEICIRGSGLALGYWNRAEATAESFVPDPTHDHYREPLYRTGDLGFWNEWGELMFSGRKDTQIKHLGYRIELGEIEVAASALDEIARACVVYASEKKEIVLFCECREPLTLGFVRGQLRGRLPPYMLPKSVVHVDSFPLNPNGKIDRRRLLTEYGE